MSEEKVTVTSPVDVRALLRDGMENDPMPRRILEWLKVNAEGKRITARTMKKMRADLGDDRVRLNWVAGMTKIVWGPGGIWEASDPSGSLLLSHNEAHPQIDTEEIKTGNPAYFKARDERNASREAALQDEAGIAELEAAIHAMREARATIKRLTAYGTPFAVVSSDVERLAGMRER